MIALVSRLTRTAPILSASTSNVPRSLATRTWNSWRRTLRNGRTWSTTRPISIVEIDRLTLERLAEILGAEQRQHAGDQPGELTPARRDLPQDLLLLVRPIGVGEPQQLGQAQHQRDRRVELVAGHLDKCRLELPGPRQLAVGLHQPGVGLLQLGDQPATLGQQVVLLDPLADDSLELGAVPRLEDVAEDVPFVDGADDRLDVGIAGEEHPDRVGLELAGLAEQHVARHAGHPLVGKDDLDVVLASSSIAAGPEGLVRTR